MNRALPAAVLAGCVACAVVLPWSVGGLDFGPPMSPAAAAGAALVGLLAGLLTSFTGCASVPTDAEFAEAKGKIETAREKFGKEQARIQLKLDKIESLVDKIQKEAASWVSADEAKMGEWAAEIQQLKESIETEEESQADTVDQVMDTAEEMIRKAEEAKAKAEDQVGQSNLVPPGGTGQQHYLVGWQQYSETLTAALDRARARLGEKRIQRARYLDAVEDGSSALKEIAQLAEGISLESNVRVIGRLGDQAGRLASRRAALLHLGFDDGWEDVTAVADFFIAAKGPTLVVNVGNAGEQKVPFSAKIHVDEASVGPFTRGDVLVVSLPEGFTLTAPLVVEASGGLVVKTCGNEAGSSTVTLLVTEDTATTPRAIVLSLDQPVTAAPGGTALLSARIWNLSRNVGVSLPVAKLPC